MTIYHFTRLVKKYSRPTKLFKKVSGDWVNGKWVEGYNEEETVQMAVIPFDLRTISQLGGQVTTSDATIYSLFPLQIGDKIEQNGNKYEVDVYSNFDKYGDFYRYIARGVSEFDKV